MRMISWMTLIFLILTLGCSMSPERAKQKLRDKGIPYSEAAFVNAVKERKGDVVNLFLAAGMNPNTGSALCKAVTFSSNEIIQMLVNKGANINDDSCGDTPFISMIKKGDSTKEHMATLKLFLDKNPDLNMKDAQGNSPLIVACNNGRADTMKMLIEKGAYCKDALPCAFYQFRRESVKLLLDNGADVNTWHRHGKTPLMMAASIRDGADMVKLLLEKGADVNAKGNTGYSALRWAVINNIDIATIQALVNKGANVNDADQQGNTVLNEAARINRMDMVKLLLGAGAVADENSLLYPAMAGHANMVEFFLKRGIIIKDNNFDRNDILMRAASYGSASVVKVMLANGFNVNATDKSGETPLIWAARSGQEGTVRVLLDHGARVDIKTSTFVTALGAAKEFGRSGVAKILQDAGAVE